MQNRKQQDPAVETLHTRKPTDGHEVASNSGKFGHKAVEFGERRRQEDL